MLDAVAWALAAARTAPCRLVGGLLAAGPLGDGPLGRHLAHDPVVAVVGDEHVGAAVRGDHAAYHVGRRVDAAAPGVAPALPLVGVEVPDSAARLDVAADLWKFDADV